MYHLPAISERESGEAEEDTRASTMDIDNPPSLLLRPGQTVDHGTCTGDLDDILFRYGCTAIVQTDISLMTRRQCKVAISALKWYVRGLQFYIPQARLARIALHDIYDAPDLTKLTHDLEVLQTQNEELVQHLVNFRKQIEEQTETIYNLSTERRNLINMKDTLNREIEAAKQREKEALAAVGRMDEVRSETADFVLRDTDGSVLFDERLLPSNSETIVQILKDGAMTTYNVYTDANEFMAARQEVASMRNVKLQAGPSFVRPGSC